MSRSPRFLRRLNVALRNAYVLACVLPQAMRRHTDKLADLRKNEDPRMSFTTPAFREQQRVFAEHFKARNFLYAPR